MDIQKRRGRCLFILFFILFLLFSTNKLTSAFDLEDRVKKHVFDNGLTVISMERSITPTFAAYIHYKVGSVDEVSGSTGIAHLLEHMMFKGTTTFGTKDYKAEEKILNELEYNYERLKEMRMAGGEDEDNNAIISKIESEIKRLQQAEQSLIIKEELDKIYSENGAANFNAYTSNDNTTYLVELPSNRFELWAILESDRMRNLVLREFYSERDVVLEERRRRIEINASSTLYEQFISTAFLVHPYRNPVIGWMSDIANLSLKDTKRFLKTHYAPNNVVITIVGDIKTEKVIEIIKRYFGDISPQELPLSNIPIELEQQGERRIEIEWDAEPAIIIGYHKPSLPHPDDDVFDMIDGILSIGRSSRLFEKLVSNKKIAVSANTFGAPGARYPNLFCFSGVPRYPHTTQDVEQAFYEEIERLKNEPIFDRELQKVRNQIESQFLKDLRSNAGMAGKLSYFEGVASDWKYILKNKERIYKVTSEDIQRVAKKYLTKNNRTVAVLVKKKD